MRWILRNYFKALINGVSQSPWYEQWILGFGLIAFLFALAEPFWPNVDWPNGYIGTVGVEGQTQAIFISVVAGSVVPISLFLWKLFSKQSQHSQE